METVVCNLCGSKRVGIAVTAKDYNFGVPGKFRVVRCRKCGLAYLSPRPTPSEIGDCYPSIYGEHNAAVAPNNFARTEAAMVVARRSEPGKVLDVGCATGYFLAAMREQQWDAYGIEPNLEASEKASLINGVQIKHGLLEDTDFASDTFDAVTFWSVLEHLHNPYDALTVAHKVLSESGYLYIGIPNFNSLERWLFGKYWFALDVPRHLYHFAPTTITNMLKRVGFHNIKVQQASGHDTFKWSMQRKIQSLLHKPIKMAPHLNSNALSSRNVSDNYLKAGTQSRKNVNKFIVGSVTSLADRMGYGSQMIVVAQPKK